MKVVVTKPAQQADFLITQIKLAGDQPVALPAVAITYLFDEHTVPALVKPLSAFDGVIFVSVNAVAASAPCIRACYRAWPKKTLVFAVGAATAAACQQAFSVLPKAPQCQYGSEAMLALPALNEVRDKKILVIGGDNIRPWLMQTLAQRGAHVSRLVCYESRLPTQLTQYARTLWQEDGVDVLMCSSEQAMVNVFQLFPESAYAWLRNKMWLLSSQRIQRAAIERGITHCRVADNAGDRALLQKLASLRTLSIY